MSSESDKALEKYFDWVNLILGALLFLSPWALQFTDHALAPWHAWIGGIVVALLAIAALAKFAVWEEWVEAAVGVWLVVAPWILGFNAVVVATGSHVVLGALVAIIAIIHGWRAHTHATA